MTPEIAIVVRDVEILSTLATERNLQLLICKPWFKFYINIMVIQEFDFLTFCRISEFILCNFRHVVMVESDGCLAAEKAGLISDLVAAHADLVACDGDHLLPARAMSDQDSLIVLCLDIDDTSVQLADPEYCRNLNMLPRRQPVAMTLSGFKQILTNEGLLPSPTCPSDVNGSINDNENPYVEHFEPAINPPDDGLRQLYVPADIEEMIDKLYLQPSDTKDILRRNLKQMKELGARRKFALAPSISALDNLQERFPNFSEVINAIARRIALARLAKIPIAYSPPILLLGKPGIGKTAFAMALAKTFETHFFEIRMNGLTAGFTIGGHDLSWSNGRPGILFNEVGLGKIINPVGLLDEIDKVSSDLRHDPLGHLFTLLESDTATRFQDEAIPLKLDLSHITWIATANDVTAIEPPLLSRFSAFEIPMPTPQQARIIVQNIYGALLEQESWGTHFVRTISEDVIEVIATAAPREARKLLIDAMGNAAAEKRNKLLASDFNQDRINRTRLQRLGFY